MWPSRGDRARTLDQVQKVLTASGLIFCVCVVSVTLLSVIFASQPTNILSLPPLPPHCAVLLFYCFLRVIISTLTLFVFLSSARYGSVEFGLVRCGLGRKSSRPHGSRAVFALTLSDIAVQLSIFGVSVFHLISLSLPLSVLRLCLVLCLLQLYLN